MIVPGTPNVELIQRPKIVQWNYESNEKTLSVINYLEDDFYKSEHWVPNEHSRVTDMNMYYNTYENLVKQNPETKLRFLLLKSVQNIIIYEKKIWIYRGLTNAKIFHIRRQNWTFAGSIPMCKVSKETCTTYILTSDYVETFYNDLMYKNKIKISDDIFLRYRATDKKKTFQEYHRTTNTLNGGSGGVRLRGGGKKKKKRKYRMESI